MPAPLAVVWGLGRFGGGAGTAIHLHDHGYEVRIVDRAGEAALAPTLAELGRRGLRARVHEEARQAFDGAALVAVNPAIPPAHPILRRLGARGIPCTQELDLFLAAYPGRPIAVTGTNGKSTTAALLAEILRTGAGDVLLGGNIGHSLLLDEARWRADQWAVVEVSSAQAARLATRHPRFAHALFTPITRDHVAWHGNLAAYHRAKLRLIDAVEPRGRILGHAGCAVLARAPRVRLIGHETDLPRVQGGELHLGQRRLFGPGDLRLRGAFNVENAALAVALACSLGIDADAAVAAVVRFAGLPHRLREVGRRDGVRFVDNGASTVAETTRRALESMAAVGRIHWVCGGRPKEAGLDAYARQLAPLAATMHLFGEVAPALGAACARTGRGAAPSVHRTLREALDGAWGAARAGDVLLFSPGFASHDQYPNFVLRAREALAWWRGLGHGPGRDSLASGET